MKDSNQSISNWLTSAPYSPVPNISDVSKANALELFHNAAEHVPAYKDFLKKNGIVKQTIQTFEDFSSVPYTSKENYIDQYSENDRVWNGSLSETHMISTSSGTTGATHYWPRSLSHEIDGAKLHEYIFRHVFSIHKKRTLFINGFAMGNWIAGTFTLACVNLLAWKGYPLTIMTPGYSLESVFDVLQDVAPKFQQTILAGHTPFLKDVVDHIKELPIDVSKLHLKLLGTGQGITENWRSHMINRVHGNEYTNTCINLYGSADASLMGFETPESITLRKYISDNQCFEDIFSDSRLPSIYNFDPRLTYIEEEKKEIIITKNSGVPLIRYNIHDEGGILTNNMLTKDLKKNQLSEFPMVYLFGRSKFMVKIYGANIYVEHVQNAVDHQDLQQYITGKFLLEVIDDVNHMQQLVCRVELNQTTNHDSGLEILIKNIFIKEVATLNREYRYVLQEMGEKVHPTVVLHGYGDATYFPSNVVKKTA